MPVLVSRMEHDGEWRNRFELRHVGCVGEDEHVQERGVIPPQPCRDDYVSDGGYTRAVTARYRCTKCGQSVADELLPSERAPGV